MSEEKKVNAITMSFTIEYAQNLLNQIFDIKNLLTSIRNLQNPPSIPTFDKTPLGDMCIQLAAAGKKKEVNTESPGHDSAIQ